MKQILPIILGITTLVFTITTIFFFVDTKNKDDIIEKKEKEIKELNTNIKDLKEDIEELEYKLKKCTNTNNNCKEEEKIETVSILKEIGLDEYKELINTEERFIILYSQTSCSHCIAYRPVFTSVLAEYNLEAYELDIQKLSSKEREEFRQLVSVPSTPYTSFVVEGKDSGAENAIRGNQSKDIIKEKLKLNGYIN